MKFNCTFCQKPCRIVEMIPEEFISAWMDCDSCNVSFEIKGNNKCRRTRFHVELKNLPYCLDLLHDRETTQILLLPPDPDETVIIVVTLPYLIDNLYPSNVKEKIKTYIMFS
jgi:hypothetical protein